MIYEKVKYAEDQSVAILARNNEAEYAGDVSVNLSAYGLNPEFSYTLTGDLPDKEHYYIYVPLYKLSDDVIDIYRKDLNPDFENEFPFGPYLSMVSLWAIPKDNPRIKVLE